MILRLTLTEQIPSGKNSIKEGFRKNGSKYRYPNKLFVAWRAQASAEFLLQRAKMYPAIRMALPLLGGLRMTVSYREITKVPANGTRDITGMQDALQHWLEYCGVIENDGQIKGLQWIDPWRTEGPCIIITLESI